MAPDDDPTDDDHPEAGSPEADPSDGTVEAVEDKPPEPGDAVDTDDGGAVVTLDDEDANQQPKPEFYANLIGSDLLSATDAGSIIVELIDLIHDDKESRKEFDNMYAEGIRRTGLGNDAPGGAEFDGASKVVHPMLSKAAIDYASRAVGELFPGGGQVVRDYVPEGDDGDVDAQRIEKAARLVRFYNWQLVYDVPEFRLEMEKLLTQTPLAGSQFLFWRWDDTQQRPIPTYWPTDNVWFPYGAASANTADRLTLVEEISDTEFKRRVRSGEYVADAPLSGDMINNDQSEASKATDRAQGTEKAFVASRVGYHLIARTYCNLDFEDDSLPYCVVTDLTNDKALSVVRNWEENDKKKQKMEWANEIPFLPWRGALTLGLVQFISTLAGGATGAIRALLDSAHINNFPAALKLKGVNFPGQSQGVSATGVTEIEGGVAGNDDIRKLVMAFPYNPPSNTLVTLLGILNDYGADFVQTSIKNLADGHRDMPVGTTLALIEQGLKTLSGIHGRLHAAMAGVLRTVHRINRMYITDEEIKNDVGILLAKRQDFQGPMDVIPVSDPEVFSDIQRFAQMQLIADRAATKPELYNQRKVEEMILKRSKIPNADKLLVTDPTPVEQNAVTENIRMAMGQPAAVFPHQDHLAHLQVMLDFLKDPMLGSNSLIAPKYLPLALQHIADHIVMWYASQFDTVMTPSLQDQDGTVNIQEAWEEKDAKVRAEIDKMFATASPRIVGSADATFAAVPGIIQAAQALLQQVAPKPQATPDKMIDAQIAQSKQSSEEQQTQLREAIKTQIAQHADQTKLMIANMEAQLTTMSDRIGAMNNGNLRGG